MPGLVGTNRHGANALGTRGWATIRHSRNEAWPINTEWVGSVDTMTTNTQAAFHNIESPLSMSETHTGEGRAEVGDDDDVNDGDEDDISFIGGSYVGGRRRQEYDEDEDDEGEAATLPSAKSSLSQNTIELGLSPFEPEVPMSFKLTNKFATWLSGSGSTNGRSVGPGGEAKPERRNSESGRHLGSSFANKIRKSFRGRRHTVSEGNLM